VNGKDTILVTDDIPSGMLNQVRVILGENNAVMVDSVIYDLKVPSGCESGLKFKVNREISAGVTYTYNPEFYPESCFADTTLADIEVFPGQTTVIDTLWFQ
jgi:hypothetical protein